MKYFRNKEFKIKNFVLLKLIIRLKTKKMQIYLSFGKLSIKTYLRIWKGMITWKWNIQNNIHIQQVYSSHSFYSYKKLTIQYLQPLANLFYEYKVIQISQVTPRGGCCKWWLALTPRGPSTLPLQILNCGRHHRSTSTVHSNWNRRKRKKWTYPKKS